MLTAAQIIQRACAVAKAPGYTVQCGQYLNSLLDDLQQTYDFDYIRKTVILPIAAGSNGYTLPEDYLRARLEERSDGLIGGSSLWRGGCFADLIHPIGLSFRDLGVGAISPTDINGQTVG